MITKKKSIFLLVLFLSLNLFSQSIIKNTEKRVLILFSGSHEFQINRETFRALELELAKSDIRLLSEYMSDNIGVYQRDKETFINFFQQKYGPHNKFDLILAYNQKAIKFCQDYASTIFPDTKILSLDIYNQSPIKEALEQQINLINDLHPKLEYLLVVTDQSNKGEYLKKYLEGYLESDLATKEKVLFMDFSQMKYSDIEKYEYYSQKNSVVLLISAYQDVTHEHMVYEEQLKFLTNNLSLPIYSFYEKNTEYVVGGYYAEFAKFAESMSGKIMLGLNNMPVTEIDLSDTEKIGLYLNYRTAKKFKINIDTYKDKALIINKNELNKEIFFRVFNNFIYVLTIILISLLIFEIVKKRKLNKELVRAQEILKLISENTNHYVLVVENKNGIIIDYNKKVGVSDFRDNIKKNQTRITDLFPADLYEIIQSNEDLTDKLIDLDFELQDITFPAKIYVFRYSYEGKDFSVIRFEDDSKTKNMILELNKKVNDSEKAVFEAKNLIDGFIREVRDPLNVKQGFQKLIETEILSELQKKEYSEIINSNTKQLIRLVEKILIYSELNSNIKVVNNHEFSVNECIREIIAKVQKNANRNGKDVKIVNYFSLSDKKDIIFNDKDYFCLVFREILDNAVNFTSEGIIECGCTHPNDGKIIFYIKDNGQGMTAEEQRIAFNKFNYPEDKKLKSSKSGIGLGLTICRNLISKMGGSIWLTSSKNQGTTVYFYLDFDMSIFKDLHNPLSQKHLSILKKKNICIIDEDLGSQKFISKQLQKYDIKLKLMPNYNFYRKFADIKDNCHIFFVDYDSGFKDFLAENRRELKDRKVSLVIMTRFILEEEIVNDLSGISYYILYKPLKQQDLINSLIEKCKD